MGLFSKAQEPLFLKEDSDAKRQLQQLLEVERSRLPREKQEQLEREIRNLKAGIAGEDAIAFELKNSHLSMVVLHDLHLVFGGLSAQIDYLVVMPKCVFVLECKNLYGNIEINARGDFIRTMRYGGRVQKEGLYSPITQNQRHIELIKAIHSENLSNPLFKALHQRWFGDFYKSVIVLANPKTVLNDRYAKKGIRSQVLRGDALVAYLRQVDAASKEFALKPAEMEQCGRRFLAFHQEQRVQAAQKYIEAYLPQEKPAPAAQAEKKQIQGPPAPVLCPRCGAPMVLRVAQKGARAGNRFYGCSRYPRCGGIVNVGEGLP